MALFDLSLGPILLGTVLNVWLYGIMVMQTVQYYANFKADQTWVKCMVAWLFVLDTLNSVFDIGLLWRYTITLFGDLKEIVHSHWLFNVEPVMTTAVSSTVQCFYAWRIAKLTGHAWIGWLLAFLAFIQFGAGLGSTIWASILVDFDRFQEGKSVVITWLGLSALIDVIITCALTWHLLTHRTGFPKTDDVITRLVRITVQTGLITSVWASVDLVIFLAVDNNLHLFFQLPLCKLYTNTLMSTLNARAGWGTDTTNEDTLDPMSCPAGGSVPKRRSPLQWRSEGSSKSNQTTVHITTTVHSQVHHDDGFELENYAAGESKYAPAGDIESNAGLRTVNPIRLPASKSKALSDAASTHSRKSSEAS
ncbi:transmembrane protein [Ceratobasidium sp. AG-Ba]|nr:transmembrane protein [Ceratobasidium sp. AG-Ba]